MTESTTPLYSDEAQTVINQLRIENDELRAELNDLLERHNRLIDVIGNHIQRSEQLFELDKQQLGKIAGQNQELMNLVMNMPKLLEDYKNSIKLAFLESIKPEIHKVVNHHNQLLEAANKYKRAAIHFKSQRDKRSKGSEVKHQQTIDKWEPYQKEYATLVAVGMTPAKAQNEIVKKIKDVIKKNPEKTPFKQIPERTTVWRNVVDKNPFLGDQPSIGN